MWETLGAELEADVEFVRGGILVPAASPAQMRLVEQGARLGAEQGLGTRMLTAREIAALIPEMKGTWLGASYTAEDGHAEPLRATQAFAAAARRHGAQLRCGTRVQAIEGGKGKVGGVLFEGGKIEAIAVVCAAGIHAARLMEPLGVTIPVRLARSTVCETHPVSAPFTRMAMWGPRVAFRPTPRGTFYLGNGYAVPGAVHDITFASLRHLRHFIPSYLANWRRMKVQVGRPLLADFARLLSGGVEPVTPSEPAVDRRKVALNEHALHELFPHLDRLGIQRSWAGLMDLTPDMIPALGSIKPMLGLYVATGFSGHGFALAPIVGKLLSELIADGRASLDLSNLDPHRFERGRTEPAREVL
jgi:glycine/D-amino acid oxidase-like deaminating enzyme